MRSGDNIFEFRGQPVGSHTDPPKTHNPTITAESEAYDCMWYAFEHGCEWSKNTSVNIAMNGAVDKLKQVLAHNLPLGGAMSCAYAAQYDELETLKFLHENGCEWDSMTLIFAIRESNLDCLKYALSNGCPHVDTKIIEIGSVFPRLGTNPHVIITDGQKKQFKCVKVAIEHGVPYDFKKCVKNNRIPREVILLLLRNSIRLRKNNTRNTNKIGIMS
mgnify:CR=1 FL=1